MPSERSAGGRRSVCRRAAVGAGVLGLSVGLLVACAPEERPSDQSTSSTAVSTTSPTAQPRAVGAPFGVNTGLGRRPDGPGYAADLGASWVRVNLSFEGSATDQAKFAQWLDAGFDLVVTTNYRRPGNVVTTYGTLSQWPNAGFPYLDEAVFRQDVRSVAETLRPWLDERRTIILQSENEIGDASVSSGAAYWRGTTDQYLQAERAFYDTVKAVDRRFQVALTSAASPNVLALIDPGNPNHAYQDGRITRLLTEGQYDVVDLHFYGCTPEIEAGGAWLAPRLKPGTSWIASEVSGPTSECPSVFSSWRADLDRFEQEKATEIDPKLAACAAGGARTCLWFSLFNLDNEVDQYNHLGLLTSTGAASPAYAAFRSFVASRH